MIGEYVKGAVRNIGRRKLFGLISVLGLGAGFAVATMIGVFLQFETSFDTMHKDHERMYRLNWINIGTGAHFATFFNPLSPNIAAAYPEKIESHTRIANGQELVTIGGETSYEVISLVDPTWFDFFSYGDVDGDARTAIQGLRNAVITKAAAHKLFGTETAVGQTFTIDGDQDFTVAAVVENNHANSHLTSNIFINMELIPVIWGWDNIWENLGSDQLYHYMKLTPGTDPVEVETLAVKYVAENAFEGAENTIKVPLQPITDIHFNTELQNEMSIRDTILGTIKTQRRPSDIYIFIVVGALTLAIAAFNFMNLQIVQISSRLREVGVRKILGATKRNIITQFMLETMLLSFMALLTGLVIAEIGLPMFGNLVGASLPTGTVFSAEVLTILAVLTMLVTVMAGAYPSLMAARLVPALALQGEVAKNVGPAKVRTGLVLIQFSMATGLIIASGVIGSQINFAFSKPQGFDATGVVTVYTSSSVARQSYPAMKQQLEQHPAIQAVSYANIVPSQDLSNGWSYSTNPDDPEQGLATRVINMGFDAFELLGMEMVAGRSYSEAFPNDEMPQLSPELTSATPGIILNETAVKTAGWQNPEEAVGKILVSTYNRNGIDYRYDFTVVGVVKDAHYRSIRSPIAPLSYNLQNGARQMIIKINPAREQEALAAIDAAWQQVVPDRPIRRTILADDYAAFYSGENRTFSLIIGFATIAVAIACVGLYGLTAYMVERRVKEVGIRKVLGATVAQIVALLSWDYTKLVIIASILIWPFVWWLMADWLSNFAYRADLEISLFVLASLATLLLAAITTSLRTMTAARANPIQALRSE